MPVADPRKSPKISIVLPTFNGERWLSDAISSVVNQTEKDWELVIVDDCSTDSSLKIALSFAQKDGRIRVISNEVNKKLPESLNIGFGNTSGEYLTWTSDDNLLKPNALEKLSIYLDNHLSVDLVSMSFDYIDECGDVIGLSDDDYPFGRTPASLLIHCNVGAAFMYRRKVARQVGEYDSKLFCGEDYDYWCRIALAGEVAYTQDNVYQYRKNGMALSATKSKLVDENTRFIKTKYAEAFFERYKYTRMDRAKFWYNTFIMQTPLCSVIELFFVMLYACTFKIVLLPFSFNRQMYKRLKYTLGIHKRYSFSLLKK